MDHPNDDVPSGEGESSRRAVLGKTLRQFWIISKAFFASERRRKARGYLIALVSLSLAVGAVQVLMSYAGRDFMNAIAKKDPQAYWFMLWLYLGTFALAVVIGVYYRWLEERLALLWREWMAQHLIKRYFNNRAYYQLRGSESVDNPDQRISEDVRNFTISSLPFLLIGLNSLVTLIAFVGVLWTISGTLVGVLLAYAFVGTAVSILIGRRLVAFTTISMKRRQTCAMVSFGCGTTRSPSPFIAVRNENTSISSIALRGSCAICETSSHGIGIWASLPTATITWQSSCP